MGESPKFGLGLTPILDRIAALLAPCLWPISVMTLRDSSDALDTEFHGFFLIPDSRFYHDIEILSSPFCDFLNALDIQYILK